MVIYLDGQETPPDYHHKGLKIVRYVDFGYICNTDVLSIRIGCNCIISVLFVIFFSNNVAILGKLYDGVLCLNLFSSYQPWLVQRTSEQMSTK